jgi:hypothetical protein
LRVLELVLETRFQARDASHEYLAVCQYDV